MNSAKSAAELLDIDCKTLPAVTDTAHALDPGAPLVWPDKGSDLAYEYTGGDRGRMRGGFRQGGQRRRAHHREQPRHLQLHASRGRSWWRPGPGDRYTVTTVGSQGVHGLRDALSKVLKSDPQSLTCSPRRWRRVWHEGFQLPRISPLVVKAVEKLARPVKWVSDRSEHFLADAHGRDHVTTGRLALDANGRVLALDIQIAANMGSYFSQFGAMIPWFAIVMMTGLYDIQAAYAVCKGVFTHRPDRRLPRRRAAPRRPS